MPANKLEVLVNYYLRFNGYFTTPNFTVHPDYRKQPGGTDADILAVRFPQSQEFQINYNFERDPLLILDSKIDFLIVEVKSGICNLNNSWQNPERKNVEYALRWMGFLATEDEIEKAAADVNQSGVWINTSKDTTVRLMCCGSEINPELQKRYPNMLQMRLDHIVEYMKVRFTLGCYQIHRENWDDCIVEFAKYCEEGQYTAELLQWIRKKNS